MIERAPDPDDGPERDLLFGWLNFHRNALARKLDGVPAQDMVSGTVAPSTLSLLGLARHLTEMERTYAVCAVGGSDLRGQYCSEDSPDGDFLGLTVDLVEPSLAAWAEEKDLADQAFAGRELDETGAGNGRSVRWNLLKLIQEYARHNGHVDLIRERIDGAAGE